MSLADSLKSGLWAFKHSRKAKIAVLAVLLIGVATSAGYVLFAGGKAPEGPSPTIVNQPERNARRIIDGVRVPLAQANFFPVGVVIENLVSARPQAGLDRANLVYEALAEGGITRFLAIYASGEEIEKIGPVRSARSYFLDWAKELDLLYVHVGGSPDALRNITAYQVKDLNQFFNSGYFWRDQERLKKGIPSEHTLYTSSELMARALRDTKAPLIGDYEGWSFVDDPPLADRPSEEKKVTINFSTFRYKVDYLYDRQTNTYERRQGEEPHLMENGTGIRVKNIAVQYVPTRLADAEGRLSMTTIGEGPAVVFRNGEVMNATWKKSSRDDRTMFFDDDGRELIFVSGTTWIEIVPDDREVIYT